MSFANWLTSNQSASQAADECADGMDIVVRHESVPAARSWLAVESANWRAIAAERRAVGQ